MATQTIDERLTPLITELVTAQVPLPLALKALEKKYIEVALALCRKNTSKAARILGVHRNTIINKRNGWKADAKRR